MDDKTKTDRTEQLEFAISQLNNVEAICLEMRKEQLVSSITTRITIRECTEARERIHKLIKNLDKTFWGN